VLERNYSVVVRAGPEPVTSEFQIRRPNSLIGPYWEILAVHRVCTDLTVLGPNCYYLKSIFPSRASVLGL